MTAGRRNAGTSKDWCTPPEYVAAIRVFFDGTIDLDPCSNAGSIVGARRALALPDQDGLKTPWTARRIFVNPPYGSDPMRGTSIRDWLAKCLEAHRTHAAEVLALVPVATNTRHWKESVWSQATGVAFLYDTRLRFFVAGVRDTKGAPMACAMVYWGSRFDAFASVFRKFGAIIDLRPQQGQVFGPVRQVPPARSPA